MEPDLYTWPLVLVILDGHEPGQAPLIREIAAEWDTEVCGLCFSFAALKARETINVN